MRMLVRVVARAAVAVLSACFGFAIVCSAQAQGPAVSAPNAKVSVEGGEYDAEGSVLGLGSITVPLAHELGFQLDGAVGEIDDDTMWGGGVHLFTRDPMRYLFGIYGSYHEWNDIEIWRIAGEAELYLDNFSIIALAGLENVDVPTFSQGLRVANRDDEHAFAHLDLAFYPFEDLKLYGGYRYIGEESLGAAGGEYLIRGLGAPASLFVKGRFGDDDHTRITGGLRIYLGGEEGKSLLSRHRTEDPGNYTPIFPKLELIQPPAQQTVKKEEPEEPEERICELSPTRFGVDGVSGPDAAAGTMGDCICPEGSFLAGNPPVLYPYAEEPQFYTCDAVEQLGID